MGGQIILVLEAPNVLLLLLPSLLTRCTTMILLQSKALGANIAHNWCENMNFHNVSLCWVIADWIITYHYYRVQLQVSQITWDQ